MEEKQASKKAKVVKIDNLSTLIDRFFPKEEIFLSVLRGKDVQRKGLLLWALMEYRSSRCGVAYVFDAMTRPFKIFYKYDSKRRTKYVDSSVSYEWCESFYRLNNFRELF